jgi:hypothetical protein
VAVKRFTTVVVSLVVIAGVAYADDKSDATGTWKYTADVNGQSIDVTIKLKVDGDKLTGTVSAADTETKIEDGKIKDGVLTFKAEFNGGQFTIKYKGTVKGDTFKGKRDVERNGETITREFEAKRVKE